jgi:hypothetical protein
VGPFLIEKLGLKDTDWWFRVYLTGTLRNHHNHPNNHAETVLRRLEFITADYNVLNQLGEFSQCWGMGSTGNKDIHRKIETAKSF